MAPVNLHKHINFIFSSYKIANVKRLIILIRANKEIYTTIKMDEMPKFTKIVHYSNNDMCA